MIYRNSELRMDQLVSYLNEDKINLSPVFQRGHVWKIGTRRKLVRNIVLGRPIPAIFIYKEPSGSRYAYNILDGKQRIESLILFIGSQNSSSGSGDGEHGEALALRNWARYFHYAKDRKDVNFWIETPEGKQKFGDLDEGQLRELGEYSIPTIEITITDQTSLDEIIDLFVDINQEGEPVKRFDVVKAIGKDNPLLRSVFELIARKEQRANDIFYKPKKNEFAYVLKQLSVVANLPEGNAKVDRMWERLLEVASFARDRKHRKPADILKSFIKSQRGSKVEKKVSASEAGEMRKIFRLLRSAYKRGVTGTPLATDQPHFYTMVTSIISSDLLDAYDIKTLENKLVKFAELVDEPPKHGKFSRSISGYLELSRRQTTDVGRRDDRQQKFLEILGQL